MNGPDTYRFAPGAPKGLLLGLSLAQLGLIGAGLGASMLALTFLHSVVVGLGVLGAFAGWTWLPVSGRPVHAWSAPVLSQLVAPRRAAAPLAVHDRPRAHRHRDGAALGGRPLPGLERLRIEAAPGDRLALGLARLGRRASFTLAVAGPSFALADEADQAGVIGSWAGVLASCAAGSLRRLQLTERVIAEPGTEQAAWLASIEDSADPAALGIYRAHLDHLLAGAVRHELYLTAAVTKAEAAPDECVALTRALEAAGFGARALRSDELAGLVASILSPDVAGPEDRSPEAAGPQAWARSWSQMRTDGACHVCFEAAELPRVPVGPDWAWPLVSADVSPGVRTMALHIELLPAEAGLRRAERAALGVEGDAAVRARWGFRSGARQGHVAAAVTEREAELAVGLSDARFALVAGVAGSSPEAAEEAARGLVASAARAQVRLRRLHGRQAEGLAALVPAAALRLPEREA